MIVGSGAGGAVAAATLAEAGLDVLVLEAGGHYNRDSYPSDHLEAIAALYRDAGLTIAEGKPPIPVPVAKVGRRHHGDQLRHLLPGARRRCSSDWRSGFGIAWARDLDADFAEAEEFLRVTQLDPERMGRNGQLAMEGAAAIGASGGPISRNAGSCVQCSSCPFGCEIDAKRGMHVSYLPRAVAAGARLRAGVEARRVLVEDGRAVGVELRRRATRADGGGALHRAGAAGGDRRRRRARHAGAAAALGPRRRARSAATSTSTPPAGSAPATRRRCAAGTGVMQSYYVDEWEPQRHPARGDLHAARLRRRLAARRRAEPPGGDARLRPRRLDRRPPLRPLRRAGSGSAPTARCAPPTS